MNLVEKSIWFKTDLGYYATKKRIAQFQFIGDWYASKGRLTFHLKKFKDVTFQITSKQSKLGIFYPKGSDYKFFLERVKPLLVKADNTSAEVKACKEVELVLKRYHTSKDVLGGMVKL